MLKKIIVNPFVVFPLLTCLVFWPLTLQLFTLKNDALTYYYPIRTLISDALNNGELPLWTPYINMGYPLHADMQSGAWNPVIWAFAFSTNYSLAAFHYELLFYLCFSGIGFYYLCRENRWTVSTAFILGAAYQLSGFMVDSVQFFACISAACYIPYLFLFFKKLITRARITDALLTALFLNLLFSGGYPSLFIITCYLLLAYAIFMFFTFADRMQHSRRLIVPIVVCLLTFLLLSLPVILSYVQHLPHLARGNKQSLDFVLQNSMPPLATFSLISPFSTTASASWLSTDPIMRNAYIGLIPLFFLIYGLFNKSVRKIKEVQFFFMTAMLMFGFALGSHFFLRQLAYYSLPLMDTFRHPALFRLFSIFCLLLVAGHSISEWQERQDPLKFQALNKIVVVFLVGLFIFSFILIVSANNKLLPGFSNGFQASQLKNILADLSFSQRFLFQLPLVLFISVTFYWITLKKKTFVFVGLLCMADLFFAAQFNMPVTVIGAKPFEEVEGAINRNTKGFPLPAMTSIEENSFNSLDSSGLKGSSLPFRKKIGRNDYYITPGNLSSQEEFYLSAERINTFKNPLIFFSDSNSSGKIQINMLSANKIECEIISSAGGSITYLQNYYPGWNAFVDGEQVSVSKTLTTFMKVDVLAGPHVLTFRYSPAVIINSWYLSIVVLTALLFYLLLRHLFPANHEQRNTKRKFQPLK